MLHFYNWRVKRSGACLRIIGYCVFPDGTHERSHKISNVGAIELHDAGSIVAYDRNGNAIARLSDKRLVPGANG